MPHTPLPPGEPVSPRDDEPRWFEPVGPDAIVEPTPPEPAGPARDPIAWRDIRWVEFGDPDQPPDEKRANRRAVEPLTRAGPEPAPPVAGPGGAAPAGGDAERDSPEPRGALPKRLVAGIARLLRLGSAAVALVVFAVFLYHGGEMLAGFAGAMTPPPPSPDRTQQPAAAAVPDRLPTAAAAPADVAVGPRAAEYLARARGGEATAQYNLAVLYALGDGAPHDYPSAASWFRKAAESGNPAAQFNLGVMYERGLGLPRDSEAAFAWYRRAAERSYPAAEYNLALAYAEGRGTRPDPIAAARWYHDAAVQGVVPAMVNVAILYETGEGTARSLPDAYAWYRAAARRGDAAAGERARELFRNLGGGDKAQAVLMAAAVAEAMLEPASAAGPIVPAATATAAPSAPPVVLKPAPRRPTGAARDADPMRRQPAG